MTTTKKMAQAEAYAAEKVTTLDSVTRPAAAVKRALALLLHLVMAAGAAFAVACWAIPAAWSERGYAAIGGEWILVICVFLGALWVLEEVRR